MCGKRFDFGRSTANRESFYFYGCSTNFVSIVDCNFNYNSTINTWKINRGNESAGDILFVYLHFIFAIVAIAYCPHWDLPCENDFSRGKFQ